jgi:hypothetical protein
MALIGCRIYENVFRTFMLLYHKRVCIRLNLVYAMGMWLSLDAASINLI